MAITGLGFDGSVNETQDAQRSRFQGNVLPVVDSRDDLAVTIDTTVARSLRVAAGTAWVPGVMITNTAATSLQFDVVATAGQSRWDALVLRVNWSNNSVTLTKVNGTAAAAPAETLPPGLTYNPGVLYDYVLALVKITNGQTSPTALTPYRMWSSKLYMADSLAPAGNATVGTEIMLRNGKRYRLMLDASNNPTWVQAGIPSTVTASVLTPAAGWAQSPSYTSRYRVDETGTRAHYDIAMRRTGAALRFAADGSLADTAICTLLGPKPDVSWGALPVQLRILGGVAATSANGIPAFGYVNNSGVLTLESGIPNMYLTPQATWSLVASFGFTRGS